MAEVDDGQALRSMVRDDAYRVVRVLADGPSGKTELVTLDGEGPLVRKRMPLALANAAAWAACLDIDEPLLPRIESLYRMPDELVVVYAYVPGQSLTELVESGGALDPLRAVALVRDVCRAVSALHVRNVVHRDITPGNVIVASDGAHLVDLGIARQRHEGTQRDTTTLGTWGFAAPEQYGFAQTDARSDVYALGRLLGYLLTGERPDTDSYEKALADAQRVDTRLARVVMRATAFEPSARFQSADELSHAAQSALASTYEVKMPQKAAPLESATKSGSEQRGFFVAPTWLIVVACLAFSVLLLWQLLLCAVSFSAITQHDPPWGAAQHAMSLAVTIGNFALAYELYQLVGMRGPYADTASPLRYLLRRACKIAVSPLPR